MNGDATNFVRTAAPLPVAARPHHPARAHEQSRCGLIFLVGALLLLLGLVAGCAHGGREAMRITAPDWLVPSTVAQIDDLHRCFVERGMVFKRPLEVEVVPVPCEGVDKYPWFAIGNQDVYGVCYGTEIHLATCGQEFSEVVLRHELGHVYAVVNRIAGVHPPVLAPCLPSWYGDQLILIQTFAGDGWTWHADTVESWVDAVPLAPAE